MRLFENREEAAVELANALSFLKGRPLVILAIPNEGIPIARVISQQLEAPMDVLVLSRLYAPRMPDQVVGAVDEHGRISLIQASTRWHNLTTQKMIPPAREAFKEMQRRRVAIRTVLPEVDARGKTVIVVSEGVATGAAMLAALSSVRERGADYIVATAPAGAEQAIWQLHEAADQVVIPHKPTKFRGVEKFYKTYAPISDAAALEMLRGFAIEHHIQTPTPQQSIMRFIADGERMIYAEVDLPAAQNGPSPVVVFAHGFESDAHSPRSTPISRRLAARGIAGVRIDFQGHGRSEGTREACTHENMVSDLGSVIENLRFDDRFDPERIGICGAGTGACAAIDAAANDRALKAVVLRGPLDHTVLPHAKAIDTPTLMIHGELERNLLEDYEVLNEALPGPHRLLRIPECTRLFNDPISWELMVDASVHWFCDHLQA
ncbi:MAG: serine aminopeptidase domain-containing protein [Phycisphaerales bacterium]